MASSFTVSESQSFTVTHARHMGAKVAADLKRIQRLYGQPSDATIANYEAELVALLKAGYLGTVTYGFRRNGQWIEPALRYTARDLAGGVANDDDPGKVRPWADTSKADFHSFLSYSASWSTLDATAKDSFKKTLPYYRQSGSEPTVSGYLEADRTYSAGGRALGRSSVRSS